jgi:hypothetical protein
MQAMKASRQHRPGQAAAAAASETQSQPLLRPQRALFIGASIALALWVLALIAIYLVDGRP